MTTSVSISRHAYAAEITKKTGYGERLATIQTTTKSEARERLALSLQPVQYLPMTHLTTNGASNLDRSGNGRNGTNNATDTSAMIEKRAGPYSGMVPQFDPLNVSWVDLLSAGLVSAVDMREMSFLVAIKVNDVGIWTDGISRTLMVLRSVNTQNQVTVQRPTTNNRLSIRRQAGNVLKTHEVTTSSVDWIVIGFDVSESNGVQQLYVNGVAAGANQIPNAWTGGALTMARLSPTITTVWYGGLAEWILFDGPIGAAEHARLALGLFSAVTTNPNPDEMDTFTETFGEVF